jgi:DMSO/TMAO reductase YedYZ heme-binding membrane subunit
MNWRHAFFSPWAKPLLAMLLALPMAWLVYATFNNLLGANPAEALSRETGDWTLRGLCLVLAITPLRQACFARLESSALLKLSAFVGVYGWQRDGILSRALACLNIHSQESPQ